jgi:hypothetical protein
MEKPLNAAMPITTRIALTDCLPLTCTRTGACCHGKMVWLNPWELARLAVVWAQIPRNWPDTGS